ncbi:MAG TPA: hypothetical protein VGY76_06715 [Solirubrobacteraceae bacterium]|nr:hypothetical protein [Solirubrobacteraceae bacterium]
MSPRFSVELWCFPHADSGTAHEPPNRSHHLGSARVLLAGLGSDHAGVGVAVEQPER